VILLIHCKTNCYVEINIVDTLFPDSGEEPEGTGKLEKL